MTKDRFFFFYMKELGQPTTHLEKVKFKSLPHTIATAKSLQSYLTLCDPIPGILQARTLEWVAISFSNA